MNESLMLCFDGWSFGQGWKGDGKASGKLYDMTCTIIMRSMMWALLTMGLNAWISGWLIAQVPEYLSESVFDASTAEHRAIGRV